jgi:hypothetical protein
MAKIQCASVLYAQLLRAAFHGPGLMEGAPVLREACA